MKKNNKRDQKRPPKYQPPTQESEQRFTSKLMQTHC